MSLREIRMVPRRDRLLMVGMGYDEEILLKARLPLWPSHPRAAITVLEGLALWSGHNIPVAVGVGANSSSCIAALLPDGPPWTSALIDLHVVEHPRPRTRQRLEGVGDFRPALQLRLPVGAR